MLEYMYLYHISKKNGMVIFNFSKCEIIVYYTNQARIKEFILEERPVLVRGLGSA